MRLPPIAMWLSFRLWGKKPCSTGGQEAGVKSVGHVFPLYVCAIIVIIRSDNIWHEFQTSTSREFLLIAFFIIFSGYEKAFDLLEVLLHHSGDEIWQTNSDCLQKLVTDMASEFKQNQVRLSLNENGKVIGQYGRDIIYYKSTVWKYSWQRWYYHKSLGSKPNCKLIGQNWRDIIYLGQ